MRNWQNTRDMILFFGGLAGVFNETFLSHAERPTLLILFAAMMGLPAFLRTDDKSQNQLPPEEVRRELEREARGRQDDYERQLEQRARERIEERRRRHGKGTE